MSMVNISSSVSSLIDCFGVGSTAEFGPRDVAGKVLLGAFEQPFADESTAVWSLRSLGRWGLGFVGCEPFRGPRGTRFEFAEFGGVV